MIFYGELNAQLATACLGIGIVLSLICYLTTNLSPAEWSHPAGSP